KALRRSIPSRAFLRLRKVVRPAHGGNEILSLSPASDDRCPAMISSGRRFTALQRLLHWVMAVCILAMLFIGVGMVSTVMPTYVPLVTIHKTLGIVILLLVLIRLGVRIRYGAPAMPADLPEPMKIAAYLSHYALYAVMIAMPLIGWGMLSASDYP